MRLSVCVGVVLLVLAIGSDVGGCLWSSSRTVKSGSCENRCGSGVSSGDGCKCNSACHNYGDCCSDYEQVCMSCHNRCPDPYVASAPCQCNMACPTHNNCCQDFEQYCNEDSGGGGGGGGGGSVTNNELYDITDQLSSLDSNNVAASIVTDFQGRTSGGATNDVAPDPLFTSVSAAALSSNTFKTFEALRDNYERSVYQTEHVTAAETAEVSAFLNAVMATPLMKKLDEFMQQKNVLAGSLRQNIERIWFTMYPRKGNTIGSSGFEHSFIGELEGNKIGGFHNWVTFYREEAANHADYKGYIEILDFNGAGYILTNRFTWYNGKKPVGGFYIGTSPEYELAVYTLCFFTRPNAKCGVMTNGVRYKVQTWEYDVNGVTVVGSAFPLT